MDVKVILGLSILLQFTAAALALRLMRVTVRRWAWALIASSLLLMAIRRCITMWRLLSGDVARPPDISAEIVALIISVLMVVGIGAIAPLFLSIRRSQHERVASEERYRALARVSPVGIFHADGGGAIRYVNERWCDLTGMSSVRARGEGWLDAIHPEDRPRVEAGWREACREAAFFHSELRLITGDRISWVLAQALPERDQGGIVVGFIGTITDITDRKHAEQALRKSEEQLTEAQRIGRIGDWSFDIDTKEIIWSDEVYRLFERDVAQGPPDYDENLAYYFPEDRERLKAHVQRAIESGASAHLDLHVRLPSGRAVHHQSFIRPVCDDSDRVVRLVGTVQDITERKLAEHQLVRERDFVATIMNTVAALTVVLDASGRIVRFNRTCEQVTGYQFDEVRGRRVWEMLLVSEEVDPVRAVFDDLRVGNFPNTHENYWVAKNGTRRLIAWTNTAITAEDDSVEYIIATGLDITDRRKAEEALRESESRYRTLVEHAPEAIVVLDCDTGRFVDANENAVHLFGRTREELCELGPVDVSPSVQADGRPSADTAREVIARAVAGEAPVFEWIHRDVGGNDIPCELRLVMLPSSQQRLVRGSITDISERKRAERRQSLLMRELDHRVKNNLASVLSLAEQTIASSDSLEGFRQSYTSRISALARTHEAMAATRWIGIDLAELVRLNLGAFVPADQSRVRIDGGSVLIPARASSALCMAVHELTTNALKHGALSNAEGTIDVRWRQRDGSALDLQWVERGGPQVLVPITPGFGTSLIRGVVTHELRGTVELDFRPDGLHCRMNIPLDT